MTTSRHILFTFLCFTFPLLVFSSTFEISGNGTIACFPSEERYSVQTWPGRGASGPVEWQWQVTGGRFAGGGTSAQGVGHEIPPVTVKWDYSRRGAGELKLTIKVNGGASQSASKTVHLGLPNPQAITIEGGGYLECDGNWFVARTEWPLAGTQTVEWEIKNGLDEYGKPISSVSRQGEGANRLFVKKANPGLPLGISVRVQSDCGTAPAASPNKIESFQNPPVRIIAPPVVEAGRENVFQVCSCTNGSCQEWKSTGAVTYVGEGSATVYFPEAGTGTVQITVEGCNGEKEAVSLEVRVSESEQKAAGDMPVAQGLRFRVFPNPSANGQLYVEVYDLVSSGSVELINLQGKTLLSVPLASGLTTLDTGGAPPGIYLLRLRTDAAEAMARVGLNLSRP